MKLSQAANTLTRMVMVPVFLAAFGFGVAQGQDRDRDRGHDDHNRDGNYQQNRDDRGRDNNYGNRDNHGNRDNYANRDNRNGYGQNRGQDFHFRDQDRNQFASHYRGDIQRWQRRPQGRPHFARGQRIPSTYRFQPVPQGYYASYPPPPGYQYGYYDGYVVAYDPTTRIIADVLDLVGAAVNQ